jgi:hypothetical protein
MVSKSCSNILPELLITELNCGCSDSTSRYKRIAKNAILPFYYDCTGVTNSYNLENCKKVFFIKNPAFYSGTSSNISSSQLTQVMRYSKLAQNVSKTPEGKRTNLNISYLNNIVINPINDIWYNGPVKYNLERESFNKFSLFTGMELKN